MQDDHDKAHSKGRANCESFMATLESYELTLSSAVQHVRRAVKQLSAEAIRPCRCLAPSIRPAETVIKRAQGLAIRKRCRRL